MNFDGMTTGELTRSVARVAVELAEMTAELERRNTRAENHVRTDATSRPPVGPVEACQIIGLINRKGEPNTRRLFTMEKAGKLPFAKSLSRKTRLYDPVGAEQWLARQRTKAA
jgi:hypothetical protein